MEKSDSNTRAPAPSRSLREAVRRARLAEAAELDSAAGRRSAELARLDVLKAALEHHFDDLPDDDDRFSLMLVPSQPARLWIDMFANVTVEPATRTYRLTRNGRQGRQALAEARDVGEMCTHVLDYMARQIVARERALDGLDALPAPPDPPPSRVPRGARVRTVAAAFAIGLLTGIVGLFAIGYLITS